MHGIVMLWVFFGCVTAFRFHHQRVPLVILVCGTACVGKSTIATQLAQRLNLPNVLQVFPYICKDIQFLSFSSIWWFFYVLYTYAFWRLCFSLFQTDMVYELLRTATEYVPNLFIPSLISSFSNTRKFIAWNNSELQI